MARGHQVRRRGRTSGGPRLRSLAARSLQCLPRFPPLSHRRATSAKSRLGSDRPRTGSPFWIVDSYAPRLRGPDTSLFRTMP